MGGAFTDDVEDADYVVLDQWEKDFFDDMWHSARAYHKPTVTPEFVIDSSEEGRLKDPKNYPTIGPRKSRARGVRSQSSTSDRKRRGRGGARVVTPRSAPHRKPPGGSPKLLSFFKETEYAESLRRIQVMFEKNKELTYDALAIHLHEKVGPFTFAHRTPSISRFLPRLFQMGNHTVRSWKNFCLHHKHTIEDLRERATGVVEARTAPHQANPHKNRPPSPPYGNIAGKGLVLAKVEPSDEDLDFAFAVDILSRWNPNEENDAALWKRMETTVRSLVPSSGL